jgi:hypothetical protein
MTDLTECSVNGSYSSNELSAQPEETDQSLKAVGIPEFCAIENHSSNEGSAQPGETVQSAKMADTAACRGKENNRIEAPSQPEGDLESGRLADITACWVKEEVAETSGGISESVKIEDLAGCCANSSSSKKRCEQSRSDERKSCDN